jgi:hypothetical protein
LTDLTVRHQGPGHVESWFVRANHPTEPRALWLKITILAPLAGPPVAEAWLVAFDTAARGWRDTVPLAEATFDPPSAAGLQVSPLGASGAVGPARLELRFVPCSEPLSILPRTWLERGFPRSKLLTPVPAMKVAGWLDLPDGRWLLDGWDGMLGHNWGREHAWEYAWGQCIFPGGAMVEGFTARVRVAGIVTPRLSALVVREGGREHRFDRLFDPWNQRADISARAWTATPP